MNLSTSITKCADYLTMGIYIPCVREIAARHIERFEGAVIDQVAVSPARHHVGVKTHNLVPVWSRAIVHRSLETWKACVARCRTSKRTVTCLVQVSLEEPGPATGPAARGGADPQEVPGLADAIAANGPAGPGEGGLVLGGVMAVAPLGRPAAPAFARLAGVAAQVRARHPAATVISAGMSGDLEEAVAAGATHLRIGTALLGGRPDFVR